MNVQFIISHCGNAFRLRVFMEIFEYFKNNILNNCDKKTTCRKNINWKKL